MDEKADSPFAQTIQQSGVRFTLGWVLLLTLVCAGVSASIYYAFQIPELRREVAALFGRTADIGIPGTGRKAHLAFLMFCYAGPLLMAGLFGAFFNLLQALTNQGWFKSFTPGDEPEEAWDADLVRKESQVTPPAANLSFRISKS